MCPSLLGWIIGSHRQVGNTTLVCCGGECLEGWLGCSYLGVLGGQVKRDLMLMLKLGATGLGSLIV